MNEFNAAFASMIDDASDAHLGRLERARQNLQRRYGISYRALERVRFCKILFDTIEDEAGYRFTCHSCEGNGIEEIDGRHQDCRFCDGQGEVIP